MRKSDYRLLTELFKVHSLSGAEERMSEYICQWISRNAPGTQVRRDAMGNLYATKGESQTYPCIVAHMDQVQMEHSADFECMRDRDCVWGYSHADRSQQGLGADDKVGIYIALACLRDYPEMKCAFFVQEELGAVGSSQCDIEFFADCRWIAECDRRGNSDFATNIGGFRMCSREFVEDARIADYGYSESRGALTDVMALTDRSVGVSCCNISCGYYEPHTDHEFVSLTDIEKCRMLVRHMVETMTEVYPWGGPLDESERENLDGIISHCDGFITYDDAESYIPGLGRREFESALDRFIKKKREDNWRRLDWR